MISAPLFCRRFVGRHDELDFIAERFDECRHGRGAMVFISGDAGAGKTRLLAEIRRRRASDGARWLAGQCLEHTQTPLAPFVELLHDAGLFEAGRLRTAPELRAGLSRLLPHIECDGGGASARTPAGDARGQFAAIRAALSRVATAAPVVAAIEDAHWADLATLDCFQFLAERIAQSRILALITYRAEALDRVHPLTLMLSRMRPAPSIWRLSLGPLSDAEMQALQGDVLAGRAALPAQTLREIRSLAEGNPLFAEELLRHAAERGDDAHLPLTLRATVLERFVRLSDAERDVLGHAAVFGRRFEPAILAQVMGRPIESIGAALRRARDLQLIVEQRSDDGQFTFRHALVREALYSELMAHERQPLHRRFALQLEAADGAHARVADLAYHWWAARDPQRATDYSERAGDAASGVLAYKDAALYFARALEFAAAGERWAGLQAKLGRTLGLAGDARRARTALEHAVRFFAGAGGAAHTSGLCREIGWLCWVVGDTADARTWFERSREEARTQPDAPVVYAALVNLAMFAASGGDADAASAFLDEAAAFGGVPFLSDVSVFYDARAHVHSLRGEIGALIADAGSGIEAARRAGDVRRMINGHVNLARAAGYAGELGVARAACNEALRLAREGFVSQREFFALVNRAFVELLAGEYPAARATVAEALEVAGDLDPALVLPRLGDFAIPLGLRLEDDELVRAFADENTLELTFRSRETLRIAPMSAAFAELALGRGAPAEARSILRRALSIVSSAEAAPGLMLLAAAHADPSVAAVARILLARWANPEDNRAGRAYLALFDASSAARSGVDPRPFAQAAAAGFGALGVPYYEAQALELERLPERALAIYRRIGDRRDAARLERETVNRRGRTKEQLTGRERDIAQLVARGKSNAQIAAQLVLSNRTVENHVSAILHKTGLRSRTELALHIRAVDAAPAIPTG